MKIAKDAVVGLHYSLKNGRGELLESNRDQQALEYLHGYGQIVPGLEKALEGLEPGENLDVIVPAEDAYGKRDEGKVVKVPRARLPDEVDAEVGTVLTVEGQDGETFPMWVTAVESGQVTLDANHPLAGETLHFAVQIDTVREATDAELLHGHAHAPGGEH